MRMWYAGDGLSGGSTTLPVRRKGDEGEMRKYRVEFLDPVEDRPCLVGVFGSSSEARYQLREEWARWSALTARGPVAHSVSDLKTNFFTVCTPSGQTIMYRVQRGPTPESGEPVS